MSDDKQKKETESKTSIKELDSPDTAVKDIPSVIKDLESQGYVVKPRSDRKEPIMTFENPPDPYPETEYSGPKDEYERILVQVTEAEVQAGINKLHQLRQDGWEIECQIFEGRYRMKKPRKLVEADRQKRLDLYRSWLKPQSVEAPSGAAGKGTKISNSVEQSGEVFTTDEIIKMTQTGVVPSAAE